MAGVLNWNMLALAAPLAVFATAAPVAAQEAAGDWMSLIEAAPGTPLPLVLHVERDDAGTLGGKVDSPMQGVEGLPLAGIAVEAGSLSFTVPAIGAS